jgi:hypothetical protein
LCRRHTGTQPSTRSGVYDKAQGELGGYILQGDHAMVRYALLAVLLMLSSACGTVRDDTEHRAAIGASAGIAIGMIGGPIGAVVGAGIGIGVAHLTAPDEEKKPE